MKTIKEVIKAKEICNDHKFRCHECSYYDDDHEVGCRSDDLDADALYYLREYSDLMEKIQRTFVEEDGKHAGKGQPRLFTGEELDNER